MYPVDAIYISVRLRIISIYFSVHFERFWITLSHLFKSSLIFTLISDLTFPSLIYLLNLLRESLAFNCFMRKVALIVFTISAKKVRTI
jgi:hypothetical protein